jgi:hypothetical protein
VNRVSGIGWLKGGSLAVVCLLLALLMGYGASTGSYRVVALTMALVLPAMAAGLGAQRVTLLLILVAPIPWYASSLGLPLTWVGVSAAAIVVLGTLALRDRAVSVVPPRGAGAWMPLAFLLSVLISMLASGDDPSVAALRSPFVATAAAVVLCLVVQASLTSPRRVELGLKAFAMSGALVAAATWLQVHFGLHYPGVFSSGKELTYQPELGRWVERVTGVVGDYELQSELLTLTAVAALWLAMTSRGRGRAAWLCVASAGVIGAAATGTRSGIIIFAFGAALLIVQMRDWRSKRLLAGALISLPLVGWLMSGALYQNGGIIDRFMVSPANGAFATMANREGLWAESLGMLHGFSDWAVGLGPGSDYATLPVYPHSVYVWLLYSQGVLGLAIFLAIVVVCMQRYFEAVIKRRSLDTAALLGMLVLLFLVNEVKIEFVRLFNYQLVIWALLGLALAARACSKERPAERIVNLKERHRTSAIPRGSSAGQFLGR